MRSRRGEAGGDDGGRVGDWGGEAVGDINSGDMSSLMIVLCCVVVVLVVVVGVVVGASGSRFLLRLLSSI